MECTRKRTWPRYSTAAVPYQCDILIPEAASGAIGASRRNVVVHHMVARACLGAKACTSSRSSDMLPRPSRLDFSGVHALPEGGV
jgi:hypothetical protein